MFKVKSVRQAIDNPRSLIHVPEPVIRVRYFRKKNIRFIFYVLYVKLMGDEIEITEE